MYFVGIDLAWSPKNKTGVTILDKLGKTIKYGLCLSNEEISAFIFEEIGESDAMIAIDAPMTVPNLLGSRIAERELSAVYRKYHAGAHPANRKRLGEYNGGLPRGEEIGLELKSNGFIEDPYLTSTKCFFEVYPHPAIVTFFDLETVLKYKPGRKRKRVYRASELDKLKNHLIDLEQANPKLTLDQKIIDTNIFELKGKKLKDFEDVLDSIVCAYIAYYAYNTKKTKIFGNLSDGYILTPLK